MSPSFSTFIAAWKGSCSSDARIECWGSRADALREDPADPSGDDQLFRLFFHWKRSNQRRHFFRRLPFGQLTKTFLASPDAGVDDLQEQLTSSRIEDEDRAVDGFGGQVAFECLVDCDTVHVCVIDEQIVSDC